MAFRKATATFPTVLTIWRWLSRDSLLHTLGIFVFKSLIAFLDFVLEKEKHFQSETIDADLHNL